MGSGAGGSGGWKELLYINSLSYKEEYYLKIYPDLASGS